MTEPFEAHSLPNHLSYSQVKELDECGEKFRLKRIYGVPETPLWGGVGGTAVHVGTEVLDWILESPDKDEDWFREKFIEVLEPPNDYPEDPEDQAEVDLIDEIIDSAFELTVEMLTWNQYQSTEIPPDDVEIPEWLRAFGEQLLELAILKEERKSGITRDRFIATPQATDAVNEKEPDRWKARVPLFIGRWLQWRRDSGWRIARLNDETPAIEVDIGGEIDGIRVEGYIDRIMLSPEGDPQPWDIKGGLAPDSPEQLGLYATLLEVRGFPRPVQGGIWLARQAKKPPKIYNLSNFDYQYFSWKYRNALTKRNEGLFVARANTASCSNGTGCSLRDYCYLTSQSPKKDLVPRPWVAGKPNIKPLQETK